MLDGLSLLDTRRHEICLGQVVGGEMVSCENRLGPSHARQTKSRTARRDPPPCIGERRDLCIMGLYGRSGRNALDPDLRK